MAIHIQPFQGWRVLFFGSPEMLVIFPPQVSPGAIHIQPLQGWRVLFFGSPEMWMIFVGEVSPGESNLKKGATPKGLNVNSPR